MQEHVEKGLSTERGGSGDTTGSVSQRIALLQASPLFSNIPSADCATIISAAHEKQFARRQTLYFEGDPVRHIVLLISGCVKVTQFGQSGSEVILRLNGPGEIVGTLGSRGAHCSTARTLQLTSGLVWDAASFEAMGECFPLLRRNTVCILEQRLQEIEERFREISTEKVGPRLSSQLVRLLSQIGKRVNGDIEVSLSREELAQLTGTTLFTVSRLLCQWEVKGIVSARREAVLIRNLKALVELGQSE
jgi:CRP/FNR family transcriptional regulator, nitrogen oxide reductase regulator